MILRKTLLNVVARTNGHLILTVSHELNFFFFQYPLLTEEFIGSGTVWFHRRGYVRCSSSMELWLVNALKGWQLRRDELEHV